MLVQCQELWISPLPSSLRVKTWGFLSNSTPGGELFCDRNARDTGLKWGGSSNFLAASFGIARGQHYPATWLAGEEKAAPGMPEKGPYPLTLQRSDSRRGRRHESTGEGKPSRKIYLSDWAMRESQGHVFREGVIKIGGG